METWNNKEMRVPGEDFEDGPWSSFKDFKDGPLLSSWTRADTYYACQIKSGERFADSHKTKYELVPARQKPLLSTIEQSSEPKKYYRG